MSHDAQSTIAQAVYANAQGCSFARVVAELEALLSRLHQAALRTRWDYDDVVMFDVAETRIVLGWSEGLSNDLPACLLLSVGPLPAAPPATTDPAHEALCSRLVERIRHRYPPEAVLWRQLPLAIEADLVDALIDCLPPLEEVLGLRPTPATATSPAAPQSPSPAEPAPAETPPVMVTSVLTLPCAIRRTAMDAPTNDNPDPPHPDTICLAKVRAALYPPQPAALAETTQMRIAAQAMNTTLIIVWAPLGAAVMTYSLLKHQRIDFSARMMAVTGTLVAWAQTPFGQQVAAMAGV